MSNGTIHLTVDESGFARQIQDVAAASTVAFEEEFRTQGRLLGAELMKRTPPFSGKTLTKMFAGRGLNAQGSQIALHDDEIEDMTAYQIGKRRVEKDIRKVIYGLNGAALSEQHTGVTLGANPNATDWGTLQKCEGKQAVRVFATKAGTVYGVDVNEWKPDASMAELAQHHQSTRGKLGRVTNAGRKDRAVGRWRWLSVLTVKEEVLKKFVAAKQKMVGQAKGGWAALFVTCGGKLGSGGWVGRHVSAGDCTARFDRGSVSIVATNHSAWATGGDPDRIIEKSLAGRAEAMKGRIAYEIEQRWKAAGRKT